VRWRLVALAGVLAFVAVVTASPHWNALTGARDPLPVHADEYVHWGYARAIAQTGSAQPPDPFSGDKPTLGTSLVSERGFQVYLAMVQSLSGLDWAPLFAFAPTVIAVFTALALYALAERWGAGVEAALWFAVVPTTLRFLGPGFLVPIAFSLPLVVVGWLLALHGERLASALLLALVVTALWSVHLMGAFLVMGVAAVTAALRARREPFRVVALTIAVLLALLVFQAAVSTAGGASGHLPDLPASVPDYGLVDLPLFLVAALGVVVAVALRDPARRVAGLALGATLAALEAVLVLRLRTDVDAFRLYDRATLAAAFVACALAGVAVAWAWRALRERRARPGASPRARGALAVALALVLAVPVGAAAFSASQTLRQPYYVMMTQDDAARYATAAAALAGRPHRAVVDPALQTTPFSDVTGIPTLYVRDPSATSIPSEIVAFFRSGANDTYFLASTSTDVVVTSGTLHSPDLRQVAPGVYVDDAVSAVRS